MKFCIAATFTEALTRLSAHEQKAVKTAAFDLQLNPAAPGLKLHRVDKSKDPNFWSVRVNDDIRLILHKSDSSLLLVHVGHHDAAYQWAERRKIERHPATGAMQLVERPVAASPTSGMEPPRKPKLFDNLRKFELMSFGVPEEWVDTVRAADEDSLFEIIHHLPQEAQEALLKLAVGERPEPPQPAAADSDPLHHPDAQRRFRILTNTEELERALEFPWERWAVFLHPDQRQLVERAFAGPARVSGSAGTGKTIVALHRTVHLARREKTSRVLLTTFSAALASTLRYRLQHLIGNEPEVAQRIHVEAIADVAQRLYTDRFGAPHTATDSDIRALIGQALRTHVSGQFTERFLLSEWNDVVDAWNLQTWEEYRDVARLGRKARLGDKQRKALWTCFAEIRKTLASRTLLTGPGLLARLTEVFSAETPRPFEFVVADEAQDLGIQQMRFLATLAGRHEDGLFLAGDLGQRIFQSPFSWKALGIDVRGRSSTLRVNYRTAHQIRTHAEQLLPESLSDVDGLVESRRGTISVFDTAPPQIATFASPEQEIQAVAAWIGERLADGYSPQEIGVFVRSEAELDRARRAATQSNTEVAELSASAVGVAGKISIGTMHMAKGLEFRAVVVMACDDKVLPLQSRIEVIADESDLEDVYNTERHLLYVACTRARDRLLVSGVEPASEFLEDLTPASRS
jgi:superfamily I DNA/RNA helicase/mRNA-degrading endonuclease RelE of RelBE toxin-antitoxin system